MVMVVMLVVPLLLATRATLASGQALARRHTLLAIPVVALLGAIVLSAALRMRLYVQYYGLSVDRFTTLVFMGWLMAVLLLLAATVLRDRGRLFVAGSVLSALGVLAALHLVSPDLVVARVNVARAADAPKDPRAALDVQYLTTLSADAVELATAATLLPSAIRDSADSAQRCEAAINLLRRWGADSPPVERASEEGAWRAWNAGEANAVRVVGANFAALVRMRHATCVRSAPPRAAPAELR
jgi:hypothetical protein